MNNNNTYQVSLFKLATERKNSNKVNWSIRGNIFISGQHSTIIADKIEKESWGSHNYQLYHYMDYTFRTRIMKNEVKIYNYKNGNIITVFHTGLYTRNTKQGLYLLAKPNNHPKKNPWWAVPKDDIEDTSNWLMTKTELMNKYGIKMNDLPKNVEYIKRINNGNKFNKNFRLNFDWRTILTRYLAPKTKTTIVDVIKKNGCNIEKKKIKYLLGNAFNDAVNNTLNKENIDEYIVPGLFLDFVEQNYWINLMMYVNVLYQNKNHTFVIVIQESYRQNEYEFVDILSLKQGFSNGRFISKLPDFWKPTPNILKKSIQVDINNNNDNDTVTIPIPIKAPLISDKMFELKEDTSADDITMDMSPVSTTVSSNIQSHISNLSISANSTVISVDIDNQQSPTPFSLNNDENKCNNNDIGLINFDNKDCNILGSIQCQYNSYTGITEQINTTKFENKQLGWVTEFITYPNGKYISKTYSMITNQLISQITGNTDLLALNL